jgi:hypothetical protein
MMDGPLIGRSQLLLPESEPETALDISRPLVVDLFAGSFGWSAGFIPEGYRSIGFDLEHCDYHGPIPARCHLVLTDVRLLRGEWFKHAAVIVASPPCQKYSYMAMPWQRAKDIAHALRNDQPDLFPDGYDGPYTVEHLNLLFNECFRIQREASEAAGRYIPLIVENVRGAQPWVGRARWNYGSFYLWGDVPALMPPVVRAQKFNPDGTAHPPGSWFAIADSKNRGAQKVPVYSDPRRNGGKGSHLTSPSENLARLYADRDAEGIKQHGSGHVWYRTGNGALPSASKRRKAASAMIAKIPFPLSVHIARVFKPAPGLESHVS